MPMSGEDYLKALEKAHEELLVAFRTRIDKAMETALGGRQRSFSVEKPDRATNVEEDVIIREYGLNGWIVTRSKDGRKLEFTPRSPR